MFLLHPLRGLLLLLLASVGLLLHALNLLRDLILRPIEHALLGLNTSDALLLDDVILSGHLLGAVELPRRCLVGTLLLGLHLDVVDGCWRNDTRGGAFGHLILAAGVFLLRLAPLASRIASLIASSTWVRKSSFQKPCMLRRSK